MKYKAIPFLVIFSIALLFGACGKEEVKEVIAPNLILLELFREVFVSMLEVLLVRCILLQEPLKLN